MNLRYLPPVVLTGLLLVLVPITCGPAVEDPDEPEWMVSECLECSTLLEELRCKDNQDNDEDGLFDCDDPDCEGIGCCGAAGPENDDQTCADGCDNDDNGYTDCEDFSCSKGSSVTVCKTAEKEPENTPEACSDGLDNDWDGFFDCKDNDCGQSPDVDFCEGNDTTCDDGLDNDGNGFTDCSDYSCSKNSQVTVCQ